MTLNLAETSASLKGAAQNTLALKRVFETINADSCPRSFNFHMHTVNSDGQLQPEELMEQAVTIGLKGLAITDHHSIGGYQVAQRWLEDWYSRKETTNSQLPVDPCLWTGVEINADLLEIQVHILGYSFDPEHPRMSPYIQGQSPQGREHQADQVISAIQEAGGLAVLAHPARYRRPPDELILEAARLGIDGIETYYAYTNPNPWKPSPKQTEKVKQLGKLYGLLNTCGTDTHGCSLLLRL